MARLHGSKRYYQLLLDPHRADLLEQLAQDAGVRTTAYARDLLYAAIRRSVDTATYGLAEAEDQALRRKSIQNQVQGRLQG